MPPSRFQIPPPSKQQSEPPPRCFSLSLLRRLQVQASRFSPWKIYSPLRLSPRGSLCSILPSIHSFPLPFVSRFFHFPLFPTHSAWGSRLAFISPLSPKFDQLEFVVFPISTESFAPPLLHLLSLLFFLSIFWNAADYICYTYSPGISSRLASRSIAPGVSFPPPSPASLQQIHV